jgi:dipeptidyl aminopeptidase/acylaminoacyl peptidase
MNRRVGWMWNLALGLLVLLSGCGAVASGPSAHEPRAGMISPLTHLRGYAVAAGDALYRISYECAGQAVEAYMTEPRAHGHYPLLVDLHGGAAWNVNQSHDNFGFTAENAANAASSHFISLYPEYQGYLGSSGPVRGLYTDAQDTLCAIRAVATLPAVNSHRVYLLGASIGGGVALKVASLLPTVRAVVVVSPWVGLRDELPWLKQHAQPYTIFGHELLGITRTYGFSPSPAAIAAQSPNVQTIRAPVLLLQGTADTHVPYQVVEQFYGQMKAAGKTVKLILYPGGHHGLHDTYQKATLVAMRQWFHQYGLH